MFALYVLRFVLHSIIYFLLNVYGCFFPQNIDAYMLTVLDELNVSSFIGMKNINISIFVSVIERLNKQLEQLLYYIIMRRSKMEPLAKLW